MIMMMIQQDTTHTDTPDAADTHAHTITQTHRHTETPTHPTVRSDDNSSLHQARAPYSLHQAPLQLTVIRNRSQPWLGNAGLLLEDHRSFVLPHNRATPCSARRRRCGSGRFWGCEEVELVDLGSWRCCNISSGRGISFCWLRGRGGGGDIAHRAA